MQALVARGDITSRRSREAGLSIHLHPRAEAIAVAACAAKRNHQPMLLAAAVEKDLRRTAQRSHDHVLPSIIIEIAESGAAAGRWSGAARLGALEASFMIHGQQRRFEIMQRGVYLLHIIQHMA